MNTLSERLKYILNNTNTSAYELARATKLNESLISRIVTGKTLKPNRSNLEMKVTDIYIKKDFRSINEANRKVLDWVFGV